MKSKIIKRLAVLAALVSVLASACIRINSDEVGVRVINIPVIHKVQQESLFTGYHLYCPYLVTVYKFPRTQMTLEMVEKGKIQFKTTGIPVETTKMAAEQGTQAPEAPEDQLQRVQQELSESDRVQIVVHDRRTGAQSVWVKTADGNDAWVDVVITYRIQPDQAWRVVNKVGDSPEDVTQVVASMVRGTIRAWLGELDTKEILRSKDREEQVEGVPLRDGSGMILNDSLGRPRKERPGAIDSLNMKLNEFGIEIIKLSAPTVTIHPDYEAVLSKKRIAEEERDEYISYQSKAIQEKSTKVNNARGQADAMIELARGRYQRILQEADAELAAKTNEAEAHRVLFNQLAQGIAAQTALLAGPGGDNQVALAISQAIQGKKIVILPSQGALNLLDINELLQNFGAVRALAAPQPLGPPRPPAPSSAAPPPGPAPGSPPPSPAPPRPQ